LKTSVSDLASFNYVKCGYVNIVII